MVSLKFEATLCEIAQIGISHVQDLPRPEQVQKGWTRLVGIASGAVHGRQAFGLDAAEIASQAVEKITRKQSSDPQPFSESYVRTTCDRLIIDHFRRTDRERAIMTHLDPNELVDHESPTDSANDPDRLDPKIRARRTVSEIRDGLQQELAWVASRISPRRFPEFVAFYSLRWMSVVVRGECAGLHVDVFNDLLPDGSADRATLQIQWGQHHVLVRDLRAGVEPILQRAILEDAPRISVSVLVHQHLEGSGIACSLRSVIGREFRVKDKVRRLYQMQGRGPVWDTYFAWLFDDQSRGLPVDLSRRF